MSIGAPPPLFGGLQVADSQQPLPDGSFEDRLAAVVLPGWLRRPSIPLAKNPSFGKSRAQTSSKISFTSSNGVELKMKKLNRFLRGSENGVGLRRQIPPRLVWAQANSLGICGSASAISRHRPVLGLRS